MDGMSIQVTLPGYSPAPSWISSHHDRLNSAKSIFAGCNFTKWDSGTNLVWSNSETVDRMRRNPRTNTDGAAALECASPACALTFLTQMGRRGCANVLQANFKQQSERSSKACALQNKQELRYEYRCGILPHQSGLKSLLYYNRLAGPYWISAFTEITIADAGVPEGAGIKSRICIDVTKIIKILIKAMYVMSITAKNS